MATQFKSVSEADLRNYTDPGSLSNGRSYYRNGYISRTARRGATLSGLSQGSSGGPYRVEAELLPRESPERGPLAGWSCTCPRGGFCKHIVALIFAWINAPERFAPRREVGELLAERSREELLRLLEDILARHPDLIDLVEATLPAPPPIASPRQAAQTTLDRAQIAAQVRQAFASDGDGDDRYDRYGYGRYDDWESGTSVDIDTLTRLRRSADDYATAGRWADAQLVYTAIVEGTTEQDEESYYDGEGEVLGVLDEAVGGLLRCLEAQTSLSPGARLAPAAREDLLHTLHEAWSHGLAYSLEATDQIPEAIIQHTTEAERATVEGWLRAALGPHGTYGREGFRRAVVSFLLALREAAGVDDETILAEYRNAGLWDEVAATLLRLGRADEALATARQWLSTPAETLAFADALLTLGGEHVDRALAFIEERLRAGEHHPDRDLGARNSEAFLTWLGHQYGLNGRPDRALELAWRRFGAAPSEQTYGAVQAAATLPDQPADLWPAERHKLLLALEERNFWGVLVNLFLREGEVGEALTALGELEQHPTNPAIGYYGYWNLGDYRLRVAQAAEQDYPDRAITIYQQIAQHHIDQRNRNHYQQAAEYLAHARTLYERQGRHEAWRDYIHDLRDRHRTLRALREELNARELE